jgi:hypothetical protein
MLVGCLIALLKCAAIIGCVWILLWLAFGGEAATEMFRLGAGVAGVVVVCAATWAIFKWILGFRHGSNETPTSQEANGATCCPKQKYGVSWVTLWGMCVVCCMSGVVLVVLQGGSDPLPAIVFLVPGLLALWLCLRLLWPRFTLHSPTIVLTRRSDGVVQGTFHQSCRRRIERATVTIQVGYEVTTRKRFQSPGDDPGSISFWPSTSFVVLAEKNHRATMESNDGGLPEIVVNFFFDVSDLPKHMVIETHTAFGGWQDYKSRF